MPDPTSDRPDDTSEPSQTPPAPGAVDETALTTTQDANHGGGAWKVLKEWWTNAEEGWGFLGEKLERKRLYFKVVMVHLRYTFAYLAFGFLVSAPLQLGAQHQAGWTAALMKCFALGGLFALPSLLLYPFTIIDWHRMRIPEFKNLELALTRWAVYLSLGFLALSGIAYPIGRLNVAQEGWLKWVCWAFDWKIAWINVVLMFFAWLRVKFHTILFREFYTLKEDDDLVLLRPKRDSDEGEVEKAGDAPKADAPKADAPKADAPKTDAPKADAPKADAPKTDAPKTDAPKTDAPTDEPKADAAKADEPKPGSDATPDEAPKPADPS